MKKIAFASSMAAILLLLGAGCAPQEEPTNLTEGEDNSGDTMEVTTVKVGWMGPLSGDAASYGESIKRGVELALKDAGLENIELIVEDSKCDAKEAVNAVNKLINVDEVQAIVGEVCSGATLAAAPIAEQNGVVMISAASTAPTVSDAGEYIFRTVPSDSAQGDFGANLVREKGFDKLAVLAINDDYGQGFNLVLNDRFPALGGEVVASETFSAGDVDLNTQLTKIKNSGAEAVFIISNSPDSAVAALKQITQLGLEVTVFASEGLKSQDILDGAKEAAEGMFVTPPASPTAEFTEAHTTEYEVEPGPFSAQAYDAMTAIASAVNGGAYTGEAIKDALLDLTFTGASGEIDFDQNGDVAGEYEVFVVKDGAFVVE